MGDLRCMFVSLEHVCTTPRSHITEGSEWRQSGGGGWGCQGWANRSLPALLVRQTQLHPRYSHHDTPSCWCRRCHRRAAAAALAAAAGAQQAPHAGRSQCRQWRAVHLTPPPCAWQGHRSHPGSCMHIIEKMVNLPGNNTVLAVYLQALVLTCMSTVHAWQTHACCWFVSHC